MSEGTPRKVVGFIQLNQEEEEKDNVVAFEPKLITGGKDTTPPIGTTWLDRLEVGTVFYVQRRNNPTDFALGLFMLVKREGNTNKITIITSPDLDKPIPVCSTRFCNVYSLYEDLGIFRDNAIEDTIDAVEEIKDIPLEESKTDGESNREPSDTK